MALFEIEDQPRPTALPGLPKCGRCGLYKGCLSPKMEPSGSGERSILVVGEAPEEQDDKEGRPFTGDAGRLLRRLLKKAGCDLNDCTITNAAICRPPKNKIEPLHVESCYPNLLRTIHEVKPNVIIPLGGQAIRALLEPEWKKGVGNVSRWVGWTIPSPLYKAWIVPTFHPSYLNRQGKDGALMKLVRTDLRKAMRLEHEPVNFVDRAALKERVEIIEDPAQARKKLKQLAKAKGTLAFDYEATGLKPEREGQRIVSAGFCLNGEDTCSMALDESCMRALSKVLLNPKTRKVAANLKFEERWTRQKLGHGVVNWYWDTMLTAHLMDNRPGITSLDFQSYVQFGMTDYSSHVGPYLKAKTANGINKIHKVNIRSLLLYGGFDALLEYMLMERQREALG